jgi:hypothetical protein
LTKESIAEINVTNENKDSKTTLNPPSLEFQPIESQKKKKKKK